jgi:hypothetical protein
VTRWRREGVRFDTFVEQYNRQRPHQALGMKVPADIYARSSRVYRGLNDLTYPFHDQTIAVTRRGRICFKGRKVNLSHVFAGQNVGVTQVGERIWLVTFMQYDLGYFDDETCRLEPIESVRPESVTYVLGMNCYPCVRNGPVKCGAPGRTRTCDPRLRRPMLYPLSYGRLCRAEASGALGPREAEALPGGRGPGSKTMIP